MHYYEIIEHTADLRIRVRGADARGLFLNAARALFEIKAERAHQRAAQQKKISVSVSAASMAELFIAWLNELLYLSVASSVIFTDFTIRALGETALDAVVTAEPAGNFTLLREIKAATYHELVFGPDEQGWQAQIIFDV